MACEHIGERELREVYAKPFEAAIRDGGLKAVMNCYLAIDGEPVTGAKRYLTDLLRGELGFSGLTISDYGSMEKLKDVFCIARDYTEAGAMALEAGLDTETPGRKCLSEEFIKHVEQGKIAEELVDTALRRILKLKFELGLFEHPYADFEVAKNVLQEDSHKKTSYDLACESMVLLKNENQLLPLKPEHKKLAVIGPCGESERALFGGYTYLAFYEGMLEMLKGIAVSMGFEGVEALKEQKAQLEAKLSQMPSVEKMVKNSYGEVLSVPEAIKIAAERYIPESTVSYVKGCGLCNAVRLLHIVRSRHL